MLVDLRESDETELVQVVLAWCKDARERGMDPGRVTPDSVVRSLIRREFERVSNPPPPQRAGGGAPQKRGILSNSAETGGHGAHRLRVLQRGAPHLPSWRGRTFHHGEAGSESPLPSPLPGPWRRHPCVIEHGLRGRQKNWDVLSPMYHRVDTASRREAMAGQDLKATDPAAHQPTKADIGIDAAPEALAWAVTRGGAERRETDHQESS